MKGLFMALMQESMDYVTNQSISGKSGINTPSPFSPSSKPAERTAKGNIILQRETWILIGGVLAALFILTVIFAVLWGKFTVMFYWVIGALAIFLTRKTDLWYMGIEVHFPLAFYTSYAFGPLFAFSMVLIAYAGVWKVRPDQGHGLMIQTATLSTMIGLSLLMKYIYGAGMSAGQFMLAFVICIVVIQLTDGILSKMFCPSPPMKIFIIHSMDLLINIYLAKLIGYPLLKYLLALA